MKIEEIRSKTGEELDFELETMKKELFEMRVKAVGEPVQNPARITRLRRAIARVNTVLHEREKGIGGQEHR